VIVGFMTQVASSALVHDNTGTAIAAGDATLAVLIALIHKCTGRTDGLAFVCSVANRLSDALDLHSFILLHIAVVADGAGFALGEPFSQGDKTILALHLVHVDERTLSVDGARGTNRGRGRADRLACSVVGVSGRSAIGRVGLLHIVALVAVVPCCAVIIINIRHSGVWAIMSIVAVKTSGRQNRRLPGSRLASNGFESCCVSDVAAKHWSVVAVELIAAGLNELKTVNKRFFGERARSTQISAGNVTVALFSTAF